ncbi:MAG TPA: uroporphyrinogen-III synthase [Afifellaceae bacterium]|nr:uroporphyrinogen-III synthase [Afifellaceae bacterium]
MRLLVTRPEPDAARTAEALRRLGHEVIVSPLFAFRPFADRRMPVRRFQAVVATSANAIRALAVHPERAPIAELPLLAVGDATALEARRTGFREVRSAGGAAADLIRLAVQSCRPADGSILYLAGESRAIDLEAPLAEAGFAVQTAVLYAMDQQPLTGQALAALRQKALDGILVYSQRAAAALALALRTAGLVPLAPEIACFCLSQAVARPLRAIAAGPVEVAAAPDQISLFAAVERVASGGEAGPSATEA